MELPNRVEASNWIESVILNAGEKMCKYLMEMCLSQTNIRSFHKPPPIRYLLVRFQSINAPVADWFTNTQIYKLIIASKWIFVFPLSHLLPIPSHLYFWMNTFTMVLNWDASGTKMSSKYPFSGWHWIPYFQITMLFHWRTLKQKRGRLLSH